MSACQTFASFTDPTLPADSDELCGQPAVCTVVMACPHEHIGQQRACAACAAELQRCGSEGWSCAHCGSADIPHLCKPLLEVRWDSGEVTRLSDPSRGAA